jgi:hypothetical protein
VPSRLQEPPESAARSSTGTRRIDTAAALTQGRVSERTYLLGSSVDKGEVTPDVHPTGP